MALAAKRVPADKVAPTAHAGSTVARGVLAVHPTPPVLFLGKQLVVRPNTLPAKGFSEAIFPTSAVRPVTIAALGRTPMGAGIPIAHTHTADLAPPMPSIQ